MGRTASTSQTNMMPPSPTPQSLSEKKSGVKKYILWVIGLCISLLVVICLLGYQQDRGQVPIEKIQQIMKHLPWESQDIKVTDENHPVERIIPYSIEFVNVAEKSAEDDVLEDWAKYDDQLRDKWMKYLQK